jgi:hypothetical protein
VVDFPEAEEALEAGVAADHGKMQPFNSSLRHTVYYVGWLA